MKKTMNVRHNAVSNICPIRLMIKVPMDAPVGRLIIRIGGFCSSCQLFALSLVQR
jgi:hypothetical protein